MFKKIDNYIKLAGYVNTLDLRQVAKKVTDTHDVYCLWKTGDDNLWLVSFGTEARQHIFLATASMIAAEVVYRYTLDSGVLNVEGRLI